MTHTNQQKTPIHLWIIGIIAILWNAMGAFDYLMTHTRADWYMSNFSQEQLDYFYSIPQWAVACWAVSVWSAFIASILLILRKRQCQTIYLISLIAYLATAFYNYGLSNGMQVLGVAFAIVIFVITLFLYFYAIAMTKKGVLN